MASKRTTRTIARRIIGAGLFAALVSQCSLRAADTPPAPLSAEQLREELAYTLGVQAYLYGYPVVEMYRARYNHAYRPDNKERTPLNRFRHNQRLLDHTFTAVVSPNNDTLYSSAWLDLAAEPLILGVPDTKGRYYSFQFMDFYTNTFAFVGKRVTGTREGAFAVVGPRWKGTLPEGLRRLDSPTSAVWLLGRTLVDGPEDLPAVQALQDRYTLTPLSSWGKKEGRPTPGRDGVGAPGQTPPPDPTRPLHFFVILNASLRENPPPAREAALMSLFARVGVGPDQAFQPDKLDPATSRGLQRAMEIGQQLTRPRPGGSGSVVNGWSFPPKGVGNCGEDYLLRAVIARTLLAALPPEEAVYPTALVDGTGQALNGKHNYVLRLEKGQTPPVDGFWSITLYRLPERLFAANPLNRYAIGDRTRGLKYGADGALELFIQHDSPGKDREPNWLPAPQGDFCLTLRGFLPRKELQEGTWKVPPVKRSD